MHFSLGSAVFNKRVNSNGRFEGHVVKISQKDGNVQILFGSSKLLDPITKTLTVVWNDRSIEEIPNQFIEPWLGLNQQASPLTPDECATLYADASNYREKRLSEYREKIAAENRKRTAFEAEAVKHIPDWAKAVIVAEYHVDRSDSQSDHFASEITRSVALAFSKSSRRMFPELRKAAALFPETAHMATNSDENREDYNGGSGLYLSELDGGSYHGWQIRKRSIRYGANTNLQIPFNEFAPVLLQPQTSLNIKEKQSTTVSRPNLPPINCVITKLYHTKKNFDYWHVQLHHTLEREEFLHLQAFCKSNFKGWYSRAFREIPGGFCFETEKHANEFAEVLQNGYRKKAA